MKYCFLLLSMLTALSLSAQVKPAAEKLSYKTPEFSVHYPSNWRLDTSGYSGTRFFIFSPKENEADNFSENVNLMIQDTKGAIKSLEEFVKASKDQISTYLQDTTSFRSSKRSHGNSEYYHLQYDIAYNQRVLQIEQYCFMKAGLFYVLTFTTQENKFKEEGQAILNAFLMK